VKPFIGLWCAREQPSPGLGLAAVDEGGRLAVRVTEDMPAGDLVDVPWCREAAGRLVRHGATIGARLFVGFPDHRGLIFF
jgi:hypothetical protein